jgi:hypothetical protein
MLVFGPKLGDRPGLVSRRRPENAAAFSLGFAVLFVMVWWAILAMFQRRGIILKI